MSEAVNKGYLLEDFRLFHLKDSLAQTVEPHFHEFDKFVMVLSGSVEYTVEGVSYRMEPWDMLFVRHHDIHRPVISREGAYERYVLWITPGYLEKCSTEGTALRVCFDRTSGQRCCLLRTEPELGRKIRRELADLEQAMKENEFGMDILKDACFAKLLVSLNRCVCAEPKQRTGDVDPKIDDVLRYINSHLSEPLTVEALASRCYFSRYYFMRRFKEATGYTVHGYIQQKRLSLAAECLEKGMSVTAAALESGFPEYSSFLRAFRKSFGIAPGEYCRRQQRMDSSYRE